VRGGTYFSLHAAKKSRQKKAAQTANAKWAPWSAAGSGASGIRVLAHSALVTKDSSAPTPHYVRRGRVCLGNQRLRLGAAGAVGFASARRSCINPAPPTSNDMSVPRNHGRGCGGARTSHGPVARRRRQNVAGGFKKYSSARAAPPEV
jgi:hypothetical protein